MAVGLGGLGGQRPPPSSALTIFNLRKREHGTKSSFLLSIVEVNAEIKQPQPASQQPREDGLGWCLITEDMSKPSRVELGAKNWWTSQAGAMDTCHITPFSTAGFCRSDFQSLQSQFWPRFEQKISTLENNNVSSKCSCSIVGICLAKKQGSNNWRLQDWCASEASNYKL